MAIANDIRIYKGEAITFYFGMAPSTFTTQAVGAGATTLPVVSTAGFATSGTAYMLVGSTVTAVTYTGVSPTSLTGCANVPASSLSGALVTSGGTNINGWTITLTIRSNANDAATVLSVTPATITSAAGGIFALSLTSTQTKTTLGVNTFAYDVQRVDAGFESVLSIGELFVGQEVLY